MAALTFMTAGPLTALLLGLAADVAGAAPAPSLVRLQAEISNAIAEVRVGVVDVRARRTPPGGWPYESAGAGIVVDPRGLVLTNQHVVGGAEQIRVQLWQRDTSPFPARIVAADRDQDLALLLLAGPGPFPTVELSTRGRPLEGERVVAIGTPLGLPHSASSGIVSHPTRTVSVADRVYRDMIQTDATVNQGNSGGPLVDRAGQVVGLVTAIFAPNGVSTGVAFAIPADRLAAFVQQGAQAAGLRQAAATLEPIRIGATMPHPFTAKCSGCHVIRSKLTISIAQNMPHPFVGNCDNCHRFAEATALASVPAAASPAAFETAQAGSKKSGWLTPSARHGALIAVAGIVIAVLSTWLWTKTRRPSP